MGEKKPLNEAEMERVFAAARDVAPEPSAELMARIIADAEAQIAATVADIVRPGRLATVLAAIGGWPAVAGLATATVVGLMFGLVIPDTLNDLTGGYLASATQFELEDLLPSYGDLLGEG